MKNKQKALVVVHPNNSYVHLADEEVGKKNARLFDSIAEKIGKIINVIPVYLLTSHLPKNEKYHTWTEISKYSDRLRVISSHNIGYRGQFLMAKEMLMRDGITTPNLCGIARHCCVKDLYNLFIGVADKRAFRGFFQEVGWGNEEIAEFFEARLDARILENLCL